MCSCSKLAAKTFGTTEEKATLMNVIFSILSVIYISAIFLFSDSPMVSNIAKFNPYSLLHIPLYGLLTGLLIFSIVPMTQPHNALKTQTPHNDLNQQPNPNNPTNQLNQTTIVNEPSVQTIRLFPNFVFPGLIALVVAIADEVHQTYIPNRYASVTDVLLDVVGIASAMLLAIHFYKKDKSTMSHRKK